jgi:RNA polymerase sigma-70 factor (ECF subfamily)
MPYDDRSDLELLAGWRQGDRSMGSALYQRYSLPISSFFRRNVRERADVEELTQDTFIALRESRSAIEHVSGYLFQIAKFKLIRHIRKRQGLPEVGDDGALMEKVAGELLPEPEYVQAQKEDTRLLLRAIRRLPLKQQLVIELSFWADRSGPEIAEILGIPLGTVASRLRHAKANLELRLKELADSQESLRATTTTLEQWRAGLREFLGDASADADASPDDELPCKD